MKRKFIAIILALVIPFSLSACSDVQKDAQAENLHYLDIYKHGILSPEEKERRAEMRQIVSDVLSPEMPEHRVSFKENRIEVTVSAFDSVINKVPDGWKGMVGTTQKTSADLSAAFEGKGGLPVVIYLADARKILLTTRDGELLYDRFWRSTQAKVKEIETKIDPQPIEDLAPEINDRDDLDLWITSSNIVYVSSRSNTIHSIPDCSGMKRYRTMDQEDADTMGYQYCQNCW